MAEKSWKEVRNAAAARIIGRLSAAQGNLAEAQAHALNADCPRLATKLEGALNVLEKEIIPEARKAFIE
jgi:hypothetical protein